MDDTILKILQRMSNWTYKHFGVDNFMIATLVLISSIPISIMLGIGAHNLAKTESNPEIAKSREMSAIMGVVLSITITTYMIFFRKYLSKILTRKRDLGQRDSFIWKSTMFLRWAIILLFFFTIPLQLHWYGMADTLLIAIAGWFMACNPPDMELRMKKEWNE